MKYFLSIALLILTSHTSVALAATAVEITAITKAATLLCRGGTEKGGDRNLEIQAKAGGQIVVLKKFAETNGDLELSLTNKEWEGIQAFSDASEFNNCIDRALPLMLQKLSAEGENKSLIVKETDFGESGQFFYSPELRPLYRNPNFTTHLNGFKLGKEDATISLELTNQLETPLRIQLDLDYQTSLSDDRGGYCVAKDRGFSIIGIPASTYCCSDVRIMQPNETISFTIAKLPCQAGISGRRASISIPFYSYSKNSSSREINKLRSSITFTNLELKR